MDSGNLQRFLERVERYHLLADDGGKHYLLSEEPTRRFALRPIVARRNIAASQMLTPELVTCKRLGTGIPAARWHKVLEQRVPRDLDEDQVLA
ncbi:hypothetical protein DFAR_2810017 [Desulfarculales bacterium]